MSPINGQILYVDNLTVLIFVYCFWTERLLHELVFANLLHSVGLFLILFTQHQLIRWKDYTRVTVYFRSFDLMIISTPTICSMFYPSRQILQHFKGNFFRFHEILETAIALCD